MRSPQKLLLVLILGALTFPLSGLASRPVKQPLTRQPEFEHASDVVEGHVKALRFADSDGKAASSGPRFTADLTVSLVHKRKGNAKLDRGDTLTVSGWATGDSRQTFVPRVKDAVLAFLQRKKDGTFEPIRPTGFRSLASSTRTFAKKMAKPAPPAKAPKRSRAK